MLSKSFLLALHQAGPKPKMPNGRTQYLPEYTDLAWEDAYLGNELTARAKVMHKQVEKLHTRARSSNELIPVAALGVWKRPRHSLPLVLCHSWSTRSIENRARGCCQPVGVFALWNYRCRTRSFIVKTISQTQSTPIQPIAEIKSTNPQKNPQPQKIT